jgi:hypothetical protein
MNIIEQYNLLIKCPICSSSILEYKITKFRFLPKKYSIYCANCGFGYKSHYRDDFESLKREYTRKCLEYVGK